MTWVVETVEHDFYIHHISVKPPREGEKEYFKTKRDAFAFVRLKRAVILRNINYKMSYIIET